MTEPLAGRGFGPGLPPQGARVSFTCDGEVLNIAGWPGISAVKREELTAQRRPDSILLEWQAPAGQCGIMLEAPAASALTGWLRGIHEQQDGATKRWLWAALFFVIGLPFLLLGIFFSYRAEVIDATVALISVEQENTLGERLWQMQHAQLRLIENTAANRFVEEAGVRLAAAKLTPYTYHFFIANDSSINAFAMPAGYIVVHRGLIEKADSAEEVAGVLAHEIEHVEQRHSLRGMAQQLGLALIAAAVTGDLSGGVAGAWVKDLAGLQFSREQETAADAGGYTRLLAAKIDPHGMASFFDKLEKEQAGMPDALALLSTHPASAERAAAIKARLAGAPALPPLTYDWAAVRASVARK